MALSIAHGSKLLDLSGPTGKQNLAQSNATNAMADAESGEDDEDDEVTSAKRSGRNGAMLKWFALNVIRLFGVIAICWAIAIQLVLLSSDVKGAKGGTTSTASNATTSAQIQNTTNADSISSVIADSSATNYSDSDSGASPSGLATTSYAVISSGPSAASAIASAEPESTDATSLLLYTATSASEETVTSAPTVSIITPVNVGSVLRRRHGRRADSSTDSQDGVATSTAASSAATTATRPTYTAASTSREYYADTTVPTIKGGLLFALLDRISTVALLCVALLGQFGLPEGLLLTYLSAFSMSSTPAAVGFCQYFVGLGMQRNYVKQTDLLPSYLLLVAGQLNLHIALYLVIMERLDIKKGRIYMFNRYQRFHGVQRILFWTELPDQLVPTMPSNPFTDERIGPQERKDSEQVLDEKLSRAAQNRDRAAQTKSYPTFKSGGISGQAIQVPRIGQDGLMVFRETNSKAAYVRDEEEEEEPEERLSVVAPPPRKRHRSDGPVVNHTARLPVTFPPISPLMSDPTISPLVVNPAAKGVPVRLQHLMQAPRPPVKNDHPSSGVSLPPSINLIPSTASTTTTGRMGMFPGMRPDTTYSSNSDQSTRSDQSALVRQAARNLPSPPMRYEGPSRARPKDHLVDRVMDQSRLMPARGVLRQPTFPGGRSEPDAPKHQPVDTGSGTLDLTGIDVRAPIVPPSPNRQTWDGNGGAPKDIASKHPRSRSVRFDVRKESGSSAISADSEISDSSGLSEFLPVARVERDTMSKRIPTSIPPRAPPPSQPPPPPPNMRKVTRMGHERLQSVSSSDEIGDPNAARHSIASIYVDATDGPDSHHRDPQRSQVSPEPATSPSAISSPLPSSRSGLSNSGSSTDNSSPQRRRTKGGA